MNIDNELKSHFFKGQGKKLNRCLSPTMDCEEKAIRAHSVQNAKALDLLSCDGHVIHLHPRLRADKPQEVCFEKIGRNQATTFTGLCAQHDQDLFRELDTQDFDGTNQSQLFLLAYRSVLRELHAVIDGGIKIQAAYQKRVELGLDPKDEPSPAGIEATYHMMQAWRTFRYRCEFDRIRETSSYEGLVHHVRNLNLEMPTIGASTFYGIGKYTGAEDIEGVIINVFPTEANTTTVVISYLAQHSETFRAEFPELLSAQGPHFNYVLSKTLIKHTENFVISPPYFDSWSEEKVKIVTNYFNSTLLNQDSNQEDENLYLF